MAIPGTSIIQPKAPPLGGQNSRDSVAAMDPSFATYIQNWICRNDVLELRKGHSEHAVGLGGPVRSLIAHNDEDGTIKMFAGASNQLWDVTTPTPVSLVGSLGSDDWQYTQLDGATVMCNGVDTPRYYTVASGMVATSYTGVPAADIIQIHNFKGRLYAVVKDSASVWYGPDGGLASGVFTEFPVGKIFSRGGHVQFVAAYARDSGSSAQELLVIMSSVGEILVYSGLFPGAPDFSIVAKFYVGRPIGRRAYFWLGPDLNIITENGIFPLSDLLSVGKVNQYAALSNALSGDWNRAARSYKNLFGWCASVWELGQYGVINVPTAEGKAIQYVFNPNSRAWSTFTGLNALCWAVSGDMLYFGTQDGKVMEMEGALTDNGEAISHEVHWAYDYLQNRTTEKSIKIVQLYLTATSNMSIDVCIDTDFKNRPTCATAIIQDNVGSVWNAGNWNSIGWNGGLRPYSLKVGVSGQGAAVQVRLKGKVSGVQVRISSISILHERGGV